MACAGCGSDNLVEARFCASYGSALEEGVRTDVAPLTCRECGHDNPAEAVFCATCGTALDATVAAPATALPVAHSSSAVAKPVADVKRPKAYMTFGYWAHSVLSIATALLALVIALGTFFLWPILAGLGACLWVLVWGTRSRTRKRVNPVVRGVLGLVLVAANGFVAFAGGALYLAFSYPANTATAVAIGLAYFAGATAAEALAILLWLGLEKLQRHLWRRARHDGPVSERYGERMRHALP